MKTVALLAAILGAFFGGRFTERHRMRRRYDAWAKKAARELADEFQQRDNLGAA